MDHAEVLAALQQFEELLETWCRASLGAYISRRQARGELFEPGRSHRAVTPEETLAMLAGESVGLEPRQAAELNEMRSRVLQSMAQCDQLTGGRFLWADLARSLRLSDVELGLLLMSYAVSMSPSLQRVCRFAANDFTRRLPGADLLWALIHPHADDRGLGRLAEIVCRSALVEFGIWEVLDPGGRVHGGNHAQL